MAKEAILAEAVIAVQGTQTGRTVLARTGQAVVKIDFGSTPISSKPWQAFALQPSDQVDTGTAIQAGMNSAVVIVLLAVVTGVSLLADAVVPVYQVHACAIVLAWAAGAFVDVVLAQCTGIAWPALTLIPI